MARTAWGNSAVLRQLVIVGLFLGCFVGFQVQEGQQGQLLGLR